MHGGDSGAKLFITEKVPLEVRNAVPLWGHRHGTKGSGQMSKVQPQQVD